MTSRPGYRTVAGGFIPEDDFAAQIRKAADKHREARIAAEQPSDDDIIAQNVPADPDSETKRPKKKGAAKATAKEGSDE